MKANQIILKNTILSLLYSLSLFFLSGYTSFAQKDNKSKEYKDYSVAAYVWPSCHDEPRSREVFWGEGIGEWEIIKKGNPLFDGHYQPKIPLWGYEMDDDPIVMEKMINAATDHGVNVFIFDWYWYDGKPFLEETVNNGFLKARNNDKMKFYIMWANCDIPGNLLNHYRYKTDSLIWQGEVDWDNFKIIVDRVIKQYFKQPNYFKIDNEPVFSIYSVTDLVQSFNGIEGTRKALDYFQEEVKKAGFPGLHIQLIGGYGKPHLLDGKYGEGKGINEIVSDLNAKSVTLYNWSSPAGLEDYLEYGEGAMSLRNKYDSTLTVPFFPCISVGWDTSPRYPKQSVIHINNTPDSFAAYLQKTKNYVNQHPEQPKLLIINAWNEWVEGSYLEPDMRWGYGYLEAVKKVMSGAYDKY
ncbi:MAG: glycoside hydrolase family 99-like domain-containing protein [Bacteroidota bacterium]